MLKQCCQELVVQTRGRGFYEMTDAVTRILQQSGLQTGLATVMVRHTSASLVIQENADPEVRRDLERLFSRLAPDGDPLFRHNAEGDDDMPAHARAALTNVSLSIPVVRGQLALGTWQGVFLWEHRRRSQSRQITVHVLGE
jgi:secondary thiamine-phosphate synthase enzyme